MGCINSKDPREGNHPTSSHKEINQELPPVFLHLWQRINTSETLSATIFSKYLSKIDHNQKDNTRIIMKFWAKYQDYNFYNQDKNLFTDAKYVSCYKNFDMLSARVYAKFIDLIQKIQNGQIHHEKTAENDRILSFFRSNDWKLSYDRFFFQSSFGMIELLPERNSEEPQINKLRIEQNNKIGIKQDRKQSNEQDSNINQINIYIQECSIPILKKLYQFMIDIDLIAISKQKTINNIFMLKLEAIQQIQYKQFYLNTIQFYSFEQIQKYELRQVQIQQMKFLQQECPNYFFYKTNISNGPSSLHKYFRKYKNLQQNRQFIGWMFPHHFIPKESKQAYPLTYLEKKLFLLDEEVGFNLLVSAFIFLDFMGIELQLQPLSLKLIDQKRLEQAFSRNSITHLTIMRILACLSITGFRVIAIKLIKLIDQCIKNGKLISIKRENVDDWKIYGNKRRAKQQCYHEEEDFPPLHSLLSRLKTNIGPKTNIEELDVESIKCKLELKPIQKSSDIFQSSLTLHQKSNIAGANRINIPQNSDRMKERMNGNPQQPQSLSQFTQATK